MASSLSSRERMTAALERRAPDHPPCSFMLFGALLRNSGSYSEFVKRQLDMGLDACVMLPPRPPVVRNDHHDLYGLPVAFHPEVRIEETVTRPEGDDEPLMIKTYHTPAGDLTTEVRQTDDWRWGDHVPFLDDYLIPRTRKFLIETLEDLAPLEYLLQPPTDAEIEDLRRESAPALDVARKHDLLVTGGWGVGSDMIGWLHGLVSLVYDIYDRPEFVRELLRQIARWNRRRMSVLLAEGIDLYLKRAWYENCDFYTPDTWQELIRPVLKADVELAHQAGARFGYIITSNAMPLVSLIAETGVDVIIGIDPETYNLPTLKEKVGGKVCLWGGVNGHLTVEHGTPEAVKTEVTTALQCLGPDGFILSPVDNVREDTPQAMSNVRTLIQTWRELTGQTP